MTIREKLQYLYLIPRQSFIFLDLFNPAATGFICRQLDIHNGIQYNKTMQNSYFPSTVSAREIQRGYKKILEKVKKTRKPIVVMTDNKPQAAIVSLDILEEYNKFKSDQELFSIIDKLQAKNRDKDPIKVLKDVTEAVEEVRRELYEKDKTKSSY